MKRWSVMFFVSILLFGGYAIVPGEAQDIVQESNIQLDEDDLPYCH